MAHRNAQRVEDEEFTGQLYHPSNLIISGPTMSGKTHLVDRLLCDRMKAFHPSPPPPVLYCYGIWQSKFDEMKSRLGNDLEFHEGLPNEDLDDYAVGREGGGIIVLDDLMDLAKDSPTVSRLFTRGMHHRNLTTIFITQNLFPEGKVSRTMSKNCQGLFLFNNPKFRSEITTLASQAFPGRAAGIHEAYDDATQGRYKYVFFDFHQRTPNDLRIRTNVLPSEQKPQVVYLFKEGR